MTTISEFGSRSSNVWSVGSDCSTGLSYPASGQRRIRVYDLTGKQLSEYLDTVNGRLVPTSANCSSGTASACGTSASGAWYTNTAKGISASCPTCRCSSYHQPRGDRPSDNSTVTTNQLASTAQWTPTASPVTTDLITVATPSAVSRGTSALDTQMPETFPTETPGEETKNTESTQPDTAVHWKHYGPGRTLRSTAPSASIAPSGPSPSTTTSTTKAGPSTTAPTAQTPSTRTLKSILKRPSAKTSTSKFARSTDIARSLLSRARTTMQSSLERVYRKPERREPDSLDIVLASSSSGTELGAADKALTRSERTVQRKSSSSDSQDSQDLLEIYDDLSTSSSSDDDDDGFFDAEETLEYRDDASGFETTALESVQASTGAAPVPANTEAGTSAPPTQPDARTDDSTAIPTAPELEEIRRKRLAKMDPNHTETTSTAPTHPKEIRNLGANWLENLKKPA